ncbi:MAG: GNAT family N-acetyltransferase [Bacteroidota bacterium]
MTKVDTTIAIERLNSSNVDGLITLFHAVHGRMVTADFFRNKYATGYAGVEYVGYIAYSNEQPVAFIGAIPCRLYDRGAIVLAAQLADGMTHPAYRNKGLFVSLVERTVELCRQNKVRLLFGFPNQHSLPVFLNRLGWEVYGKMDHFSLPVTTLPLEKISQKLPFLKNGYQNYQQKILKRYSQDISATHEPWFPGQYPAVYRTSEYLQYKSRDTFFIAIKKAFVWLKINNGLLIGDILVSGNEIDTVMRILTGIARKLGVDKISFHCSSGNPVHTLLAGKYPSTPSFPVIFKDLGSGMELEKIKFTYADMDIF